MLLGITAITYLAICLTPGGPAAGLMGDFNPKISPEYRQKQIKQFHFDRPFYIQYGYWISNLVHLNFGETAKDNQPVIKKIAERLPRTLLLTGLSLLLSFILAVPIGIISALKHNTWVDRTFTVLVFLGFSVPTYWVALLLMIGLGIHLGWLPITGYKSILADDLNLFGQIWDVLKHLILPMLVTALTGLASMTRYVRNGMLEVIRQDYIRTARAKGLPESTVLFKHAFRNTLIPMVTILGLSLPDLISAGFIFETIFSYPGLGRLGYEAYMTRDVFLIMGVSTLGALLTLVGNLIADVLYALVDPRIRYR